MVVRTETCIFSGRKIYPGRGRFFVPCSSVNSTRPIFHVESKKARRLMERRVRPKQITWTALYRKLHKKDLKKKKKDKDSFPKRLKNKQDYAFMTMAELKAKREAILRERKEKKPSKKKDTRKEKLDKKRKKEQRKRKSKLAKREVRATKIVKKVHQGDKRR